jgi:hypothetical protein
MYQVGQVLFIILNKKQQVIPVQVTEQVVRRSLNGEEISYSVSVPNRGENRVIELDSIDGEVFESIKEVQATMFEHANYVITTITDKAISVAEKRFDHIGLASPDDIDGFPSLPSMPDAIGSGNETIRHSKNDNADSIKVELDNGTIANVNVKMPNISDLV